MIRASVPQSSGTGISNTFTGDNTGATDVTAALQAFCEAAGSAAVYLPEGYYYTRNLDPLNHLNLIGLGKGAIFYSDSDVPAINFNKGNPLKDTPTEASPYIGGSQQSVLAQNVATISAISVGSTTTVTFTATHSFNTGDYIVFRGVGGTTQLNDNIYKVEKNSGTQIRLLNLGDTRLNSTGFGAFTSGGTAECYFPITGAVDGDDMVTRISVASVSGYNKGDVVHICSQDIYPSDQTNVRVGEAAKVLWVDPVNNYIYLYGQVECAYLYKTSPIITRYKQTQTVSLTNIGVQARPANGNWQDHSISPRSAGIDIYGVPYVKITKLAGQNTFAQAIILRGCPYSVVEGETTNNIPNIITYDPGASQYNITGITKANPCVVTFSHTSQPFTVGAYIIIRNVSGMTEINSGVGKAYRVSAIATVSAGSSYSVTLQDLNEVAINSTGYGTYTSGGTISLGDVDGLGYGVSVYGACHNTVIKNCIYQQCRHAWTTDARGDASFSSQEWFLYGVPTRITVDGCLCFDSMGPSGDTHAEGEWPLFVNSTFKVPSRGWLGGSYLPLNFQIRCRTSIIRNCTFEGGLWGLRYANVCTPGAFEHHILENCLFRNTLSADLVTDYAIRIEDRGTRTFPTIININNCTFEDCAIGLFTGISTRIEGRNNAFNRCTYAIDARAGTTINLANTTCDYRRTKRLGNTGYVAVMRSDGTYGGAQVRLMGLTTIQGELTSYPTSIFRERDTTATKTYDINNWININPSGVTETILCSMNSGTSTSLQQATGATSQHGTLYLNQAQANATVVVPAGCVVAGITIRNKTANAVTGGIRVGTTNGGAEVVTATAVAGSAFVASTINAYTLSTSAQTLYIQAVTSWNSAVLDVVVHYRRAII